MWEYVGAFVWCNVGFYGSLLDFRTSIGAQRTSWHCDKSLLPGAPCQFKSCVHRLHCFVRVVFPSFETPRIVRGSTCVAALRSTLSTPTPALPTTLSLPAEASKTLDCSCCKFHCACSGKEGENQFEMRKPLRATPAPDCGDCMTGETSRGLRAGCRSMGLGKVTVVGCSGAGVGKDGSEGILRTGLETEDRAGCPCTVSEAALRAGWP